MKRELNEHLKALVGKPLSYLRSNNLRFQVSKVNGHKCPISFPETGRLRVEVATSEGSQIQTKTFMGLKYQEPDVGYTNDAVITDVVLEVDPGLFLFVGKTVRQLRTFLYSYQQMDIKDYGAQKRDLTPNYLLGRVLVSILEVDPSKAEDDQVISSIYVQGA